MSATFDSDFVVVGAGLSGLVAGYQLVGRGASVRVLEASQCCERLLRRSSYCRSLN
jgi:ribulose 1,5-bisphosphate synthetase/thiazole synthase